MYALTFTGELSVGSISIVVTLVTIAVTIGLRLGTIQTLVRGHTITLVEHAQRLDRYEKTLIDVGGNLQRMIGRIEATQDRIDRATGFRSSDHA